MSVLWGSLSHGIDMAATVAFAVTAMLAIRSDRDVDLFGATVLGLITAIGGGTIRDLILDVPVFWSTDLTYVWSAAIHWNLRVPAEADLRSARPSAG